jgi:hypothetical protein
MDKVNPNGITIKGAGAPFFFSKESGNWGYIIALLSLKAFF